MQAALERSEQALLFLNRRGYAPLTLCRACGHRFACPNCDAWLVDHRFRRQLVCHHCGFADAAAGRLPEMPGGRQLRRLRARASSGWRRRSPRCFPSARMLVLSSDLVATIERMREELEARSRDGRVDIVIGTQLVAKGHHFPKLNLVGVVDADLGLANGDPRAAERTFQLLHQVAGRAGREDGPRPRLSADPSARASGDAGADRAATARRSTPSEIAAREQHGLSAVRPAGEPGRLRPATGTPTEGHARAARRRARRTTSAVRVLGPAEAPLALVRGRHRFRLLVKSPRALRSLGLSARLARRRAEAEGRRQARGRHRSAELFLATEIVFSVIPGPTSGRAWRVRGRSPES